MRFMVIVKADRNSEAGVLPGKEMLTKMGKFNEELVKAGVMLAGEGLRASSKGARVRFHGGKKTVVDGPFAETKELVAGFWLWQVKSKEEAVEWLKRAPFEETEVEIRQVFEASDFGDDFSGELREQEEEMRAKSGMAQKAPAKSGRLSKNLFVNLPVKDLKRSVAFFTKLGYTFNAQFTDENATCMVVGENLFVMLLVEKFFKTFTTKPIADAKETTESLTCLSCESRDEVQHVVETALEAGAKRTKDPQDHGFMYGWGFEDLDGHVWEYVWMDPAHVQK